MKEEETVAWEILDILGAIRGTTHHLAPGSTICKYWANICGVAISLLIAATVRLFQLPAVMGYNRRS
jgi:hypothetical protein